MKKVIRVIIIVMKTRKHIKIKILQRLNIIQHLEIKFLLLDSKVLKIQQNNFQTHNLVPKEIFFF
jgi:hypothetical protein